MGVGGILETHIPGLPSLLLRISEPKSDRAKIRPLTKNHNVSVAYVNKYLGHTSTGESWLGSAAWPCWSALAQSHIGVSGWLPDEGWAPLGQPSSDPCACMLSLPQGPWSYIMHVFSWQHQKHKGASLTSQAHFKPLLPHVCRISNWPQQNLAKHWRGKVCSSRGN